MSKVTLLGAASLAVALMAAPAYAQNAGGGAGGGASVAANNSGGGAGAGDNNASTGGGAGGNMAGGAGDANTLVGGGKYANVGMGSYTADQQYITGGNNNGGGGNNAGGNNNNNNWRPSQRNPLLADNADARASKVIGTSVYNAQNQKLGSIDDILLGTNGVFAVISTNNKQVAVPFGDLMFGNANNQSDEKVVMPQETQERLNTLPYFRYDVTNYPGVNADNYKSGGVNVAGNNAGGGGTGANGGANVGGAGAGAGAGGAGAGNGNH
ncbi:MAG: PRC-barrel domain-containing protein [Acetobacteraceae bacterium]|nr:PRC-barrel domain-containing protein [Acetobacteraceae bacterium]